MRKLGDETSEFNGQHLFQKVDGGRASLVTILSARKIGEWGRSTIYAIKTDKGVFALKNYEEEKREEGVDMKQFVDEQLTMHKTIKKAGICTRETYRKNTQDDQLLMTYWNKEEHFALLTVRDGWIVNTNEVNKTTTIDPTVSFISFLEKVSDIVVKATKNNLVAGVHGYFFLYDSKEKKIVPLLGDIDNIVEYEKNPHAQALSVSNINEAIESVWLFIEQYAPVEKKWEREEQYNIWKNDLKNMDLD